MPLTQQELESRLWAAVNALRGPVDPADFKTYVFPMLFWKWISDTWDYERAQAVEDFGPDVAPEVEADYHRFTLPNDTHWNDVTIKTDNLGSHIGRALAKIEQANPDTLAGVFGDAAWGNKERLPEPALINLIDAFNGAHLDPTEVNNDLLGQGYEYLLKNFADESGKKAGEFFTPRQVVDLIVHILNPQPGESVYDPTCGSGGMLVETINSVRTSGGDARTLRLYGQEINLTTSAIARMNLFLHDIEDFKIVRGDTLRQPGFREADGTLTKFDVLIANPPFSIKKWGAETWAQDPRALGGVPPADKADMAFIQHMVYSMNPEHGRVGVVMPMGVLFRSGAEQAIRKHLVEADLLEAVISLPENLFYSTPIPTCVLIFNAKKPKARKDHVLYVDGSARFTKGKKQNIMTPDDREAIVNAYRTGEDPDGEGGVNVRLVPVSEIAENDYDLSPSRYLKAKAVAKADPFALFAEYQIASQAATESEKAMLEQLKTLGFEVDQ